MFKKNKKHIFFFSFFIALFICLSIFIQATSIAPASASDNANLAQATTRISADDFSDSDINLTEFIQLFYIYLSRLTGFVSLLMLIIAIYIYMTSSGDPKKIGTAKEYIVGAIIGLVAVALAYTFFEVLNPGIMEFRLPS